MQFQITHPWQVTSLTRVSTHPCQHDNCLKTGAWAKKKIGINCSMLSARTCKNQRNLSNLFIIIHSKTRSKLWQVYCKGLQKSVPHLGDPTPPQSRAEVNFVCFPDELLVKVVVASSGDADAANSHFSGIFKVLILHLSPSRSAAATELQAPARHSTGEEFGEGFRSAPALR